MELYSSIINFLGKVIQALVGPVLGFLYGKEKKENEVLKENAKIIEKQKEAIARPSLSGRALLDRMRKSKL